MTWEDIDGWFDYQNLYDEAVTLCPPFGVMIEVGCWHGRSVCYLGEKATDAYKCLSVFAVEHGMGDSFLRPSANVAPILISNVVACGLLEVVHPIIARSTVAASIFADKSVDFVFIDAGHDYPSAISDITAWLPKVKSGGVLAGHDYGGVWTGVTKAVDETFGDRVQHIEPSSWWVDIT